MSLAVCQEGPGGGEVDLGQERVPVTDRVCQRAPEAVPPHRPAAPAPGERQTPAADRRFTNIASKKPLIFQMMRGGQMGMFELCHYCLCAFLRFACWGNSAHFI